MYRPRTSTDGPLPMRAADYFPGAFNAGPDRQAFNSGRVFPAELDLENMPKSRKVDMLAFLIQDLVASGEIHLPSQRNWLAANEQQPTVSSTRFFPENEQQPTVSSARLAYDGYQRRNEADGRVQVNNQQPNESNQFRLFDLHRNLAEKPTGWSSEMDDSLEKEEPWMLQTRMGAVPLANKFHLLAEQEDEIYHETETARIETAQKRQHGLSPQNQNLDKKKPKQDPSPKETVWTVSSLEQYVCAWQTIQQKDHTIDEQWVDNTLSYWRPLPAETKFKILFRLAVSNKASAMLWLQGSDKDRQEVTEYWITMNSKDRDRVMHTWQRGLEMPPRKPFFWVISTNQIRKVKNDYQARHPASTAATTSPKEHQPAAPPADPPQQRTEPAKQPKQSASEKKQQSAASAEGRTERQSIAIIVDGVKAGFSTKLEVLRELIRVAPAIQFKKVDKMPKGGICLIPAINCRAQAEELFFNQGLPPDAFGGQKLSIHRPGETAVPEEVKRLNQTRVVVKDVDRSLTKDEIAELLVESSSEPLTPKEIVWLTPPSKKFGLLRLTFEDEQTASKLREKGKLAIGCVLYNVTTCAPKPPLLQCFKCQQWGHLASSCPSPDEICLRCCETGHKLKDCPVEKGSRDLVCANCHETGHLANSHLCKLYLTSRATQLEALKKKVQLKPAPPPDNVWQRRAEQCNSRIMELLEEFIAQFVPKESANEATEKVAELVSMLKGSFSVINNFNVISSDKRS